MPEIVNRLASTSAPADEITVGDTEVMVALVDEEDVVVVVVVVVVVEEVLP